MPNLCCSCANEVEESHLSYLEFQYNVPGETAQNGAVALVCPDCFKEAHDPKLFPVHEALINSNLVRVERPSKRFTPENWK